MERRGISIRLRLLEEGHAGGVQKTDNDRFRSLLRSTFTWHHLLVAIVVIVPSALKCRAAQKGQAVLTNMLDLITGVVFALGIMLLSALKKQKISVLLWFFEHDFRVHLRLGLVILIRLFFRPRRLILRVLAVLFVKKDVASSGTLRGQFRMTPVQVSQQFIRSRRVTADDGRASSPASSSAPEHTDESNSNDSTSQGMSVTEDPNSTFESPGSTCTSDSFESIAESDYGSDLLDPTTPQYPVPLDIGNFRWIDEEISDDKLRELFEFFGLHEGGCFIWRDQEILDDTLMRFSEYFGRNLRCQTQNL